MVSEVRLKKVSTDSLFIPAPRSCVNGSLAVADVTLLPRLHRVRQATCQAVKHNKISIA